MINVQKFYGKSPTPCSEKVRFQDREKREAIIDAQILDKNRYFARK